MKPKQAQYIQDMIEQEGFDYLFLHYSDFKEIQDKEFHELRKAYVKSAHALAAYLGVEL